MRTWLIGIGALSVTAGIIVACVGDDPAPGGDGNADGGGSSSGSSGGSSGTTADGDLPVNDAGVDACANANLDNDAKNCGACGRDCVHGACISGVCQHWVVTKTDGGILRGPGTNGTHVFYSVGGDVWRVQTDGGSPVEMSSLLDGRAFAPGPNGMLVCGDVASDAGVYQLANVPGALPTKTHNVDACIALVADGTTLWAGRTTSVDEITTITTRVHSFANFSERLTGGMAVGSQRLYWVNQNSGVWNAPKATPDAGRATVNIDQLNEPGGVAVTESHAYVTSRPPDGGTGGILARLSLDGGAASTLITSLPQPAFGQHIARAPDGALYFAIGDTLYGFVPPP